MREVYSHPGAFWLRATAWAAAASALLAAGLALAGVGLAAFGASRTGEWPGELQRSALLALFVAVYVQALLPHGLLTAVGWLALVRFAPRLDRSWRTLAPGLFGVAAAWFPVVARLFRAWTPARPSDVLFTAVLLSLAAAAALLVPRAVAPALRPGAFAGGPFPK